MIHHQSLSQRIDQHQNSHLPILYSHLGSEDWEEVGVLETKVNIQSFLINTHMLIHWVWVGQVFRLSRLSVCGMAWFC